MGNAFKFLLEYNDYIRNIENSDKDNYIYNEILQKSKFGRLPILEGLIFTYPADKSVNILSRRFPELKIEIDKDGEIYIENQPPQELNKYLPIITNLGYFISKFTIDGEEWFNKSKETDKPVAFYIEAKYDYEVDIPKILYHASPIKLKHKILKYGLTPKSGSKLSDHPDRIYLTDDINKAIEFGEYLKSGKDNEWYKNGYCIYSVNGHGVSKLYSDVNLREGGFYTMDNIKVDDIKLIKEVST
jgi:hypothetical protein